MKDIKVLGTGCANCKNTIALIEQGLRKAMATKTEKPFKLRDRSVGGNGLTPEFQNASWE